MSGYNICKYCGEYEHDCRCSASREIQKLKHQLSSANEALKLASEALKELQSQMGNKTISLPKTIAALSHSAIQEILGKGGDVK